MKCKCGELVDLGYNVQAIPRLAVCAKCAKLKNAKIRRDVIRRGGVKGNLSLRNGINIIFGGHNG
ncbi:MAG: hypothetical protein GXP46_01930 [Deferribacteres bacterium]|nr:hypothetical protein [Deferribacteres bacterium]